MFGIIKNCTKYSDKILWTIVIAIATYDLILIASVSRENFNCFTVQAFSIGIGILGAILLQIVDYQTVSKASVWIAGACILLMLYTLFAGVSIEGSAGVSARAWIKLPGGITFQPSELVKIGFIITFAHHISILKKSEHLKSFKNIMILALHALVPVILTHAQGDDGAAIIFLCIAVTMAFMGGLPLRYFACVGLLAILSAPLIWKFILADYQKQRILNQMNPEGDPLNMGYQQIQGKLSIGSGGIFGTGLFRGPRVANSTVPIQESDFIFSAAGEELGFIGCALILLLLLILILRTGFIAIKSKDITGYMICFGFVGLIAFQTIFNLGMCLSLLPVMGVTLPFFSAGGSSAACLYLGMGILQNIYLNRNQTKNNLNAF